jgi:hypothetical protein
MSGGDSARERGALVARRAEIGASVAAAVLALITLLAVLFLPLVPVCGTGVRCATSAPLVSLASQGERVDPTVWLYIVMMAGWTLLGALGGLLDYARPSGSGVALLGTFALLAFAACAVAGLGVFGSLYLPSVLALLIAVVAAIARRRPLALPLRPR